MINTSTNIDEANRCLSKATDVLYELCRSSNAHHCDLLLTDLKFLRVKRLVQKSIDLAGRGNESFKNVVKEWLKSQKWNNQKPLPRNVERELELIINSPNSIPVISTSPADTPDIWEQIYRTFGGIYGFVKKASDFAWNRIPFVNKMYLPRYWPYIFWLYTIIILIIISLKISPPEPKQDLHLLALDENLTDDEKQRRRFEIMHTPSFYLQYFLNSFLMCFPICFVIFFVGGLAGSGVVLRRNVGENQE